MKCLIGQIKKSVILLFTVGLLMPFLAEESNAQTWTTVYETDFSTSDTGASHWFTTNPSNYYWDSLSGTYFTDNYTSSGFPVSGDWATHEIPDSILYSGQSFKLSFDVKPVQGGGTGDVCIGLFGPNMESHSGTEEAIFLIMGGYNNETYLEGHESGGELIQSPEGIAPNTWTENEWHQVEIHYDTGVDSVYVTVMRDASVVYSWSVETTSGFSNSLSYLGVSMKGAWSTPGRHATANIDNVLFEVDACSGDSYLVCGDMDWSGDINITDLTLLVNYMFKGGPPPCGVAK